MTSHVANSLSKAWLDKASKELGNNRIQLDIEKIRVYKKSGVWEIVLKSSHYIPYQKKVLLEKRLEKEFFDINQIQLRVIYQKSLNEIISNFELIWRDIQEYMREDMPSVSWLESCSYSWHGNTLLISTDQATKYEILNFKGVSCWIEEWFRFTFRQSICVNIHQKEETFSSSEYFLERDKEDKELIRQITSDLLILKETNSNNAMTENETVLLGRQLKEQPVSIETLREDTGRTIIEGCIFDMESTILRGGKYLITLDVTDYTSSINVKMFLEPEKGKALLNNLKKGNWYRFGGDCQYDKYQREIVIIASDIQTASSRIRMDEAVEKRIELHAHTQMSSLDAVAPVSSLIERAAIWGHSAVAITDHGVVQAFPEAYDAGKKHGVKIIFGVEAYLVNDCRPIIQYSRSDNFNDTFVVIDIETTGLNAIDDEIIEIGAVKIREKKIIDFFHTFVAPVKNIPSKITELTGIKFDMVKNAPSINEVLPRLFEFCGDAALVAHNASFDIGFIQQKAKFLGYRFSQPIIDTLALSRELLTDLKRYKLDVVAKHLDVNLKNHHRAIDDAEATAKILIRLFEILQDQGASTLEEVNSMFRQRSNLNGLPSYHAIILVKNKIGLKNLYRLVSMSHMEYYYRRPRIPKSLLAEYREGLLIGTACEAGELYRAILNNQSEEEISEIIEFYDYLEIQPIGNNQHLVDNGTVKDNETLQKINKMIFGLGRKHNKFVVATGDVHFIDPHDEYFRRILMSVQNFDEADNQAPLYFKTTNEMLNEFSYLGDIGARHVVIEAPRSIAAEIEDIQPIPEKLYPPEIPGAEEEIRDMAIKTAMSIYGSPLPDIVKNRLDKELKSIIGNGYAVLYLIAHKLVKKSNEDGYLVGSRGSVGSSLVATMTGITEVNPLPPHYICPNCKNSDFNVDVEKYGCGVDLPDLNCPSCGCVYAKDGFDIPFEVFLGFEGDKVPDIDLNFSGEYQAIAHKYTEELFGEGYVFRAGTIGTIAEKTAYGFVKKYLESKGIVATNSEIKRLVAGCTGVKRTTGQHPGGILVVPKSKEIYEFTPIQHPANDKSSGVITSHFDFHAIHDTLVKLDILGHDDPTVIRMLEDITGVDAKTIPLAEETTMKLFSSTEPLNVSPEDINSPVGTYGVPEFGTKFVRQMLIDTRPTTFAELIRISGLSHGTDVWLNNAQDLIQNGTATLSEVI
jgi:DNA polymerase-3 subunit alpha (Gram-positive type)